MIIAGAGGHALECFDILAKEGLPKHLEFFDDGINLTLFQNKYRIFKDQISLENHFKIDPRFILGVGNPKYRLLFFERLVHAGGQMINLEGFQNTISPFANFFGADIFNHCFVGSEVWIGKGSLINTGAQVHHEASIGDFCEISPKAVILGAAKIGNQTRIGASATILPQIEVGKNVIIGAGSVITKDVPDNVLVVGAPGRVVKVLNT